jgi:peptidoglycan/LPS O-acetylase OafA/YrhL
MIALGGLHAFTALTAAFTIRSARNTSLAQATRRRVTSLVLPWLFWCAFYGLSGGLDRLRHGENPLAWLTPSAPLIGTTIHLWFLPFAFLVGLALHFPARRSEGAAWVGWLAALPVVIAVSCSMEHLALPEPFGQWRSVMPGVALGGCLGCLAPSERSNWPKLAVAASVVAATLIVAIVLGYWMTALPLLVGLLPTVIAWGTGRSRDQRLFALSGLSFGIYLVHPFFSRLFHGQLESSPWTLFAATSLASLVFVFVLQRTPLRRFV